MAGGGVPPLRFADGGKIDYADYPAMYPDLWNTWGNSAQDTYDRVIRLGMSPEYAAYYDALPDHLKANQPRPASGPDDPAWVYEANQQMNQWGVSEGVNPFPPQTTPIGNTNPWGNSGGNLPGGGGGRGTGTGGGGTGGAGTGGTGTGGGGTGGGGTGGGGTGGGGTGGGGGGGGGGGNWGGGGSGGTFTPPPAYTPPEFPNLAFGYPWIPEELKALRAALGLVPGGGGMPTEPPAVSTKSSSPSKDARSGGIMSLMERN